MKLEVLSQWKSDIQSKDKSIQIDTLEEIVNAINNLNKKTYVKFINSDLNYFLSEILIYQHRSTTCLVIKIICHLSEVPEFFKNDFFRYIRPSLRLINSFSTDYVSDNNIDEAYYKKNILAFNTIILKRAQTFNVNFKDERFPKVSIAITASSLTNLDSKMIEKLEFINTVLDIFRLMQSSFTDMNYQEKKLIEILKSLKMSNKDLIDENYFMQISRILHTIINFLPANNENVDKILVNLITEKFIILIRFVVGDTRDLPCSSYVIFLNLFYYIFTSIVFINVHYMILNYFLTLNGLNFLIYMANNIKSDILVFKARTIISEVMLHLLKIFLAVDDDDMVSISQLRQKYLKIVLKSDIDGRNQSFDRCDELSRESLLFIIFKHYVLLKWKHIRIRKAKIMSLMAFITEVFRKMKIVMDKGIASMLFYVYTSNYVNIIVDDNNLIESSSAILSKFVGNVNVIVDLEFLNWLFINNSKARGNYEKFLNYILSPKSTEEFKNVQQCDLLDAIDIKFLIQMFMNDKIPVQNLEKVVRLMCILSLNLKDFSKICTFYEKNRKDGDRRRSIYALKILCENSEKQMSKIRLSKTCDVVSKTLKESVDMHERLLAVHLLIKLGDNRINNMRKIK